MDGDLLAVIRGIGLVAPGAPVELTPVTGGVSSDIWRVESGATVFVVKRALSKLRVAADWRAPVSRNRYEVEWMRTVAAILPEAVPRVLAADAAAGAFAMEYCEPDRYPVWKGQLLRGCVELETAAEVGRRMVTIHSRTAGDERVASAFPTGDIFHAIRLEPYLEATARRHPVVAGRLMELSRSTQEERRALVHGDISPKNILAGPRGPVFLDAECAWYGDPAFDVAFCLNHLLLKSLAVRAAAPRLLAAFDALSSAYFEGVDWEPRADVLGRAGRLLPALFLARVDGKSPVEYLPGAAEREMVRQLALPLIAGTSESPDTLRRVVAERISVQEEE